MNRELKQIYFRSSAHFVQRGQGPRIALVFFFLLAFAARSFGDIRVELDEEGSFVLLSARTGEVAGWYDAEILLSHFPGVVSKDQVDGRLTHRSGEDWAALKSEPPYALRNGRPLKDVVPPKIHEGKLFVNLKFIRDFLPRLMERKLTVFQDFAGRARIIVLDAGHGGGDFGSLGIGGATEKEAMLALSGEIAKLLSEKGYEVHQTRQSDMDMGLEQRAAIANYWEADAFISLHASGKNRPQARGFEVMAPREPPKNVNPNSWQGGQVGRSAESWRLAYMLRSSLGESLSTYDRGLIEISSPLLEAVKASACLIEVGNLSWTPDAETLSSREGKSLLAKAVAKALDSFFQPNE